MTSRSATLLALPAAAALALSLSACGPGADTLTVYSGRTENLIGPLLDRYAEEADVDVEVRYGSSADLALLISEEGRNSPADVFISQSPGATGFLAGEDLLGALSTETLGLVDEAFRDADGQWVGMSGRVRTVVVNIELFDPADLPPSVFDLTDDEFAGIVALAPTNGSFQDFVTAMRQEYGDDVAQEWLAGMAANDSPTYADNTSIVQAVGRGEVPLGLVNHYYNERALAEDPDLPTANAFFEDGDIGNLLITTAVAPLAERTESAEDFVRFMLSEQAQTFFAEETFEYPLAAGVAPPETLPPLDGLGVATVDLNDLGGGLERTLELIAASGLGS